MNQLWDPNQPPPNDDPPWWVTFTRRATDMAIGASNLLWDNRGNIARWVLDEFSPKSMAERVVRAPIDAPRMLMQDPEERDLADELAYGAMPVYGEVMDAKDAVHYAQQGRYGSAAFSGLFAALPFVSAGSIRSALRRGKSPPVYTGYGSSSPGEVELRDRTWFSENRHNADGYAPAEHGGSMVDGEYVPGPPQLNAGGRVTSARLEGTLWDQTAGGPDHNTIVDAVFDARFRGKRRRIDDEYFHDDYWGLPESIPDPAKDPDTAQVVFDYAEQFGNPTDDIEEAWDTIVREHLRWRMDPDAGGSLHWADSGSREFEGEVLAGLEDIGVDMVRMQDDDNISWVALNRGAISEEPAWGPRATPEEDLARLGLDEAGPLPEAGGRGPSGMLLDPPAPRAAPGAMPDDEFQAWLRSAKNERSVQSIRHLPREQAEIAAQAGVHLRRDKTGQYIGAPRGIDSPQKLAAWRRMMEQKAIAGAEHANAPFWYDEGRGAVASATPNDAAASQMAEELAAFSPSATPITNSGFGIRAHNSLSAGIPPERGAMTQRLNAVTNPRFEGGNVRQGPKTQPFAGTLDPAQPRPAVGTNDLWHGRAAGYTGGKKGADETFDRGFTPQEHTFMDGENLLLRQRLDAKRAAGMEWPHVDMAQASIWVDQRALEYMSADPKLTRAAALEKAQEDFGQVLPEYRANATWESQPGQGTGHLPEMQGEGWDAREAYHNASPWVDDRGRDILYDAAGVWNMPGDDMLGVFEGGYNPGRVSHPLAGFKIGGDGEVDPHTRELFSAVEHLRAYTDAQDAGAWHILSEAGQRGVKARDAGSLFFPLDRTMDPTEVQNLRSRGEQFGLFDVSDTGRGALLTNFGADPPDGRELLRQLNANRGAGMQELVDVFPEDVDARRVFRDGGYQETGLNATPGSGAATRRLEVQLLNEAHPDLIARLDADPKVRAAYMEKFEQDALLEAERGFTPREDIQRARKILSNQGLEGLFRALREGVPLPGIAIGLLGSYALRQERRQRQEGAGA